MTFRASVWISVRRWLSAVSGSDGGSGLGRVWFVRSELVFEGLVHSDSRRFCFMSRLEFGQNNKSVQSKMVQVSQPWPTSPFDLLLLGTYTMSEKNPTQKKRKHRGKAPPGPDQAVIGWKEEEFQNLVRGMNFRPEWGAQYPPAGSTALDAPWVISLCMLRFSGRVVSGCR
ncbi:hypothetical protein HanPI659440_Chr12g0465161 [Helianthus annuus]|nr:hypothetical protein HanPI659440_Chr12g0465161 [Helianthus annuus]